MTNHKITRYRLDLAEIDLKISNRRHELHLLELSRAAVARQLREALFAEVAGYGPDDTPCEPRRSAYTDDPAGDFAFRCAEKKWETFSKLAAVTREWPEVHLDFVEAARD